MDEKEKKKKKEDISEEERKILREEIDKIYTPLAEAQKEILKRWEDKELKKKVEEFLGGDIPEFFKKEPKVYFARHIISPNFELLNFLKVVESLGMNFSFIEHTKDKFISRNSSKYHVCRLFFHEGKSKCGHNRISGMKIVDMKNIDGKSIETIKTNWGEDLTFFHHKLLNAVFPNIEHKIFNLSIWQKCGEKLAKDFYGYYLAIFICNGILFENFLLNDEEINFTKNVVIPAFKKMEENLGTKPLVVRMLPRTKEEEVYWFHYQLFLKSAAKNLIYNKK